MANLELKTASGGSVTLVPEDGVSNVTATVKHESGVLASEFDAGVGRTWKDVTGSRSLGVTYTNTSGRDKFVCITANDSNILAVAVSGLTVSSQADFITGNNSALSFIVPRDATYSVTQTGSGTLILWTELD